MLIHSSATENLPVAWLPKKKKKKTQLENRFESLRSIFCS